MNHMYYVAASGQPGQEQRMEGMWRSLVGHIQDIHEQNDDTYAMCDHAHLKEEERNKEWLTPGKIKRLWTNSYVVYNCLFELAT